MADLQLEPRYADALRTVGGGHVTYTMDGLCASYRDEATGQRVGDALGGLFLRRLAKTIEDVPWVRGRVEPTAAGLAWLGAHRSADDA